MACHHPIPAWQCQNGEVFLHKERPDSKPLRLPCGQCLGCRMANAKAWALRCTLELQRHTTSVFTTLTYDDKHLPPTLQKRDLQLFLKKLRRKRKIRFFASGEYGEENHRPHYHAIIYGANEADDQLVEHTWGQGFTQTDPITPERIAYCAGYTANKLGWKQQEREQVDPTTGEVYQWQPPFLQMSRRPGIGGHARQWPDSWRLYAINNGQRMPVPRLLHESYKQQATAYELEQLLDEKYQIALNRDTTNLIAAEKIAIAQQQQKANNRKL